MATHHASVRTLSANQPRTSQVIDMDTQEITVRRTSVNLLDAEALDDIWKCYQRFATRGRESFDRGLRSADEMFLFHHVEHDELKGFTALKVLETYTDDAAEYVLYSYYADLVPELRGLNLLQGLVLRRCLELKLQRPGQRGYLMFTASTPTSYLWLTRNLYKYWPHRERTTPQHVTHLMKDVMARLDIDGWMPEKGVVRRHGTVRYHGEDRDALTDESTKLDIAFYHQLNPGADEGDSLPCICPLSFANAMHLVRNMAARAVRKVAPKQ